MHLLQSATFKQECGANTEYKACSAALPGGIGGQLDEIANAASPPATSNKLALPTLFKMWQES